MTHRSRRGLAALLVAWTLAWAWPAGALDAGLGAVPIGVERQNPHDAVRGFLEAAHRGDYARAAFYLDLDYLPRAEQSTRGFQLARRLKFVLDRKLPVDLSNLSKAPEGDPADPRFDSLGALPLKGATVPIRLQRVASDAGPVWVFSESTMKTVDELFDEYGPLFAETLPPLFFEGTWLGLEPWQWLGLVVTVLGGLALSLVLERLMLALGLRVARWTRIEWDDELVAAGQGPLRLPFFAGLLAAGSSFLLLPRPVQLLCDRVSYSLVIIAVAWFILRFLRVSEAFVQGRVTSETGDVGRARSLRTQLAVLRRVFEVATYVVGAALLLMQFEVVRNVGVSLLASAGIAGLVIGLAAQKSISTLLAGIQLSITQPIRIGDQVVIEGEFGTVEEITLTYVVLRIWDQRRMVIPITQFLDKPFQNWSKSTPELLGVVTLQVDYFADIDALRVELRRILENEARHAWDGRVQTLVVLDVQDKTLTLRALVSAANPDRVSELRFLVRERLVVFLRARPQWLPTLRTETRPAPSLPDPAPVPPLAGPRD
ncbi:mechanosensitive ion channel family protein [Corallococcus sp. H22C18031201]|uniref:mechanosensitive ion channel family protein n=1 Tax=Citreicoccus inhibens TaxID=2849499 RepID=UPI000E73C1C0|nr:mechanosensitive ion channel domain-containing protein [Citreicoccus inhibens]MBU8899296.1 mechanosensitive ion channel family protein [Citreicoccus inhibens]RJS25775.1 mechanosensitive ion channel family protein [Corallococcus sp. H22C18031201]